MTPLKIDNLTAHDGHFIHTQFSAPKGAIKAAVHLNHGMGEHSGRYAHVISALHASGYAVWPMIIAAMAKRPNTIRPHWAI